jgi:hypothetical protein
MKIQKLIIPCLLVLAAACGKIDENTPGRNPYNPNVLEKARQNYCGPDREMAENSGATNTAFQYMYKTGRVFAFSTGKDEPCAVVKSFEQRFDNNNSTYLFKMAIDDQCVANNSIWEVINSGLDKYGFYNYTLREITEDAYQGDNRKITMSASNGLNGKVARDLVHLRILECKN